VVQNQVHLAVVVVVQVRLEQMLLQTIMVAMVVTGLVLILLGYLP
jgi:hypothetical protein